MFLAVVVVVVVVIVFVAGPFGIGDISVSRSGTGWWRFADS
jgi:hypothetical protein